MLYLAMLLLSPLILVMGELEEMLIPFFVGGVAAVGYLVSGWKRNKFVWEGLWSDNGFGELSVGKRWRLYSEYFFFAQVLTVPVMAFAPVPGIPYEILWAALPICGWGLGFWNRGIKLPYRQEDL